MGKVKVYQFILLEPNEIERRKSSRWGTREAIGGLKDHAEIIEGSAILVDETEARPARSRSRPRHRLACRRRRRRQRRDRRAPAGRAVALESGAQAIANRLAAIDMRKLAVKLSLAFSGGSW